MVPWAADRKLLKPSHSQAWGFLIPGVHWRLLEGSYTKIRVDRLLEAGQEKVSGAVLVFINPKWMDVSRNPVPY
jgi:hypothetical protein